MLIPPSWVLTHIVRICLVVIPLSITAHYLFSLSSGTSTSRNGHSSPKTLFQSTFSSSYPKESFLTHLVSHEMDSAFNGGALSQLCDRTTFHPGLIFSCEPVEGGIGNVRNSILNCLRYTLEAGASQFILPQIVPSTKNSKAKKPPVSMDHFFDTEHFTTSLRESCPQITILTSTNDLWDKPSTSPPVYILPKIFGRPYVHTSILSSPERWSANFRNHLSSVHSKRYSASEPILISLRNPLLLQWPLSYDSAAFVENFSRLLRFRKDVREVAATVLYAMDQEFHLGIEPKKQGIQPNQFYGAHLRTAIDATAVGWTPYATQSRNYISDALEKEIGLIYLVCGSPADARRFVHEARENGVEVTTKEQLLKGEEKRRLEAMSWDLRSLVDWEVFLRASAFGGTYESSFAWGVAVKRHVVEGQGVWGLDHAEQGGAEAERRRRKKRAVVPVKSARINAPQGPDESEAAPLDPTTNIAQAPKPQVAHPPKAVPQVPGAAAEAVADAEEIEIPAASVKGAPIQPQNAASQNDVSQAKPPIVNVAGSTPPLQPVKPAQKADPVKPVVSTAGVSAGDVMTPGAGDLAQVKKPAVSPQQAASKPANPVTPPTTPNTQPAAATPQGQPAKAASPASPANAQPAPVPPPVQPAPAPPKAEPAQPAAEESDEYWVYIPKPSKEEEEAAREAHRHGEKEEGRVPYQDRRPSEVPSQEKFTEYDAAAAQGGRGAQSFQDRYSTVFGPVDESIAMFLGGMWP